MRSDIHRCLLHAGRSAARQKLLEEQKGQAEQYDALRQRMVADSMSMSEAMMSAQAELQAAEADNEQLLREGAHE